MFKWCQILWLTWHFFFAVDYRRLKQSSTTVFSCLSWKSTVTTGSSVQSHELEPCQSRIGNMWMDVQFSSKQKSKWDFSLLWTVFFFFLGVHFFVTYYKGLCSNDFFLLLSTKCFLSLFFFPPHLFVFISRFSAVQKHTVEFNQLAMANSEGSEAMLNRVMTKDNIGVAVLLEVRKEIIEISCE